YHAQWNTRAGANSRTAARHVAGTARSASANRTLACTLASRRASLPARRSTSTSSPPATSRRTSAEPTKPAPPVTRTRAIATTRSSVAAHLPGVRDVVLERIEPRAAGRVVRVRAAVRDHRLAGADRGEAVPRVGRHLHEAVVVAAEE